MRGPRRLAPAGPGGAPASRETRNHEGTTLSAFTADAAATLEGPEWLQGARRAAFERFDHAALPTDAEEVWRYSRIGELDLDRYRPVSQGAGSTGIPPAVAGPLAAIGPRSGLVVLGNGWPLTTESSHPA